MNNSIFFLLLIFILPFSMGCYSSEKKATQQLYDEMMKIHDDVMPKMANINKLSKTIEKKLEHLEEGTPQYQSAKKAMLDLNLADKAMWDWMNQYADNSQKVPKNELKNFYKEEKEKIQKVSDSMLFSIEAGEKIIKALEEMSEN